MRSNSPSAAAEVGQLRDPYDEAIDAQVARDGQLDAGELPPPSPDYIRLIRELLWERTFRGRFGDRDYAIGVYQAHITQGHREHADRAAAGFPGERRLAAAGPVTPPASESEPDPLMRLRRPL